MPLDRLMNKPAMYKVSDTEKLSADLSKLLVGPEWTDVTFIVEGEQLKAHRCILASRCEYFRAILFGDFVESTQKDIYLDVKAKPFKCILQFLYTGRSELSNGEVENLLDIVDLAHQYDIGQLVSHVGNILQHMISFETIHWILNIAVKYDMKELLAETLKFADLNAPAVVNHVAFTSLSHVAVQLLLKRDSFAAAEIDIFNAVKAWCDKRPTEKNADILGIVRWSLISSDNIFKVVRPSGIVSSDVLLDAIEQQWTEKLPFRFVLAKDKEIPWKSVPDESYIDLSRIHFINCIKWPSNNVMKLVEVSVDSKSWKPLLVSACQVKDTKNVWKYWKFPSIGARFIRLYNDAVMLFGLESSFAVMYRSHI